MTSRAVLLALMACNGAGPSKTTTTTGSPAVGTPAGTPGGTVTTPTTPHVRCDARADSVLLYDCVALLPSESPGAAFLEDPTGALRALEATQVADELFFTVWMLHAQTTYTVRVQPASGAELQTQFTTEAIPSEHAVAPIITGIFTSGVGRCPWPSGVGRCCFRSGTGRACARTMTWSCSSTASGRTRC